MPAHISPPRTDIEGLAELAPLWAELHAHHREVSDYRALVEDVEDSWARRLDWYRRLIADGASYLTASDDSARIIGYAMVAIEEGPDDTFEAQGGTAELVTLIVARGRRSAGVGRALLRAAEEIASGHGVDTVKVAVMSGNMRAQEFYEDHGYAVAEQVLYRRVVRPACAPENRTCA